MPFDSWDGQFLPPSRFATPMSRVTAIDPAAQQIALARENLPGQLRDRTEFHSSAFEDFAAASEPSAFDIVILSWSLC